MHLQVTVFSVNVHVVEEFSLVTAAKDAFFFLLMNRFSIQISLEKSIFFDRLLGI